MTDIQANANWEKSKEKLKQKIAVLTNKDQLLWEGENEDVIARLQLKLGKTKEELLKIISRLF